jgi:AcrR family transcriptional regulator
VGKADRTRERLLLCALDLFERQGFEATTVAQIAAAAGVTPMTFFRHFAAKENVIGDDPYDPHIVAAIATQPHGVPPLVRAARGIRAAWAAIPEPDSELIRRRVRIAAATPSLRGSASEAVTRDLIAEALVAGGVSAISARAAASATMAAMTTALYEWASRPELSLAEAVHIVLDVLEGRIVTGTETL